MGKMAFRSKRMIGAARPPTQPCHSGGDENLIAQGGKLGILR